ncbi:hypothetical protein FLAG1_11561 [Fusarium langsethiae]|uniref:BTB domain-containing protein n=1 Tax=Fusarium langsethiae TaxID=179993 RepID=A0A0N0DAT0_FUSLA|nr:hypothetical protein FLAG1_11561 [Fusarium langsethiae]
MSSRLKSSTFGSNIDVYKSPPITLVVDGKDKYYISACLAARVSKVLEDAMSNPQQEPMQREYHFPPGTKKEMVERWLQYVHTGRYDSFPDATSETSGTNEEMESVSPSTFPEGTISTCLADTNDESESVASGTFSEGTNDEIESIASDTIQEGLPSPEPSVNTKIVFPYSVKGFITQMRDYLRDGIKLSCPYTTTKCDPFWEFYKKKPEGAYKVEYPSTNATPACREACLIGHANLYIFAQRMEMPETLLEDTCLRTMFFLLRQFDHESDKFSTLAELIDLIYGNTTQTDDKARELVALYISLFAEYLEDKLENSLNNHKDFERDFRHQVISRLRARYKKRPISETTEEYHDDTRSTKRSKHL